MKRIISIVLVVGVFLGVKMFNKHRASNEVKKQSMEQMQQQLAPILGKDYVTELVNASHSDAMDESYKFGGKRQSDSFDQAAYVRSLRQHMATKMRQDGKGGLAVVVGNGF